jgi:uncharacterized membrane protein (UPF0136 family)
MSAVSPRNKKLLSLFSGLLFGSALSVVGWYALRPESWQGAALITAVFAVTTALLVTYACPQKTEKIIGYVISILNP